MPTRTGPQLWNAGPTKPDGDTDPDTRALDYLIDTGWTCAHTVLNNTTPTTVSDQGGQLIIDRCLTYGLLAPWSMWVDTSTMPYSDHRALGGEVAIIGDRKAQ